MLLHPSNFLLLDEPTNHLDLQAKDVLLRSLESFTGTVVFVSHDRYFIDRLATRVFEIEDGHVEIYPGNYEDYVRRKQGIAAAGNGASAPVAVGYTPPEPAAKQKRVNPLKLQQLEQRCRSIEQRVAGLEAEIAHAEREMAVFKSVEETQRLSDLIAERRSELDKLMAEWEEASQSLESARA